MDIGGQEPVAFHFHPASATGTIQPLRGKETFMNREIQLHDSEISAVSHCDGSTSIVFSTAEVHESAGLPGYDPGLLWDQAAIITLEGATAPSLTVETPIWAIGGSLRIGRTVHSSFIPAAGWFQEEVELVIVLSTQDGSDGGTLKLKGSGVRIELVGEPSDAVEFNECPRRSID